MTVSEFIAWAQGYYGGYPTGQQADVFSYLRETYTESELSALQRVLRLRCPSNIRQVNGYPPDISRMETVRDEVVGEIESEQRRLREEKAARFLTSPRDVAETRSDLLELDWSIVLEKALTKNRREIWGRG